MKIFKNKKGSQLVEKILMAAFAVAGGGAVITYGVSVINASKTTDVSLGGGVVATSSSGVQLIAGHKYKISDFSPFQSLYSFTTKDDYEYISVSDFRWEDGREVEYLKNSGNIFSGFVGYSCWDYDEDLKKFYLEEPTECISELCYVIDETMNSYINWFSPETINDSKPRLNDNAVCADVYQSKCFVFSGTYVRHGNGPCLLDYLVEIE